MNNLHPAPLKKRLGAFLIDYVVIVLYGLCLAGIAVLFYHTFFGKIPDLINIIGPFGTQLIGFIALTLPVGLYLYVTESGTYHASIGKRMMKLSVKGLPGAVSKPQIAIRTIVKFLPWEIAHMFVHQTIYYSQNNSTPPLWVMSGLIVANVLPFIYVGFIFIRKDHRGPHDLTARTVVVSSK